MRKYINMIQSMFSMKQSNAHTFTDVVNGQKVCFYKDKFDDEYMAHPPYYPFKFRVKVNR
jgi:hypothetical protein